VVHFQPLFAVLGYHLPDMQRAQDRLEDKIECLSNDAINVRPVKLTRRRKPSFCAHIHWTNSQDDPGYRYLCSARHFGAPLLPHFPFKIGTSVKIGQNARGKNGQSDLARSGAPEASLSIKLSFDGAAYFYFRDLLESKISGPKALLPIL
jgi:hypothetical protein